MMDGNRTNDSATGRATLSVVVITHNEAANIARCLSSVAWADEIVVVDSGSTDATIEIARKHRATVHEIRWSGYGPAKMFGLGKVHGDWVLSVDADEEVSESLGGEMRQVLSHGGRHSGFDMPRLTNFLGRWIRHCGWYPDRVLRLFRRDAGRFDDSPVHERVLIDGFCGHLHGDLLHHSYPTLEHYLDKSNRYTTAGAQEAFRQGRRAGLFDLVIRPAASFISHYFVRRGFMDGVEGLMISTLSATAVFVKYSKLRTMQKQTPKERPKV